MKEHKNSFEKALQFLIRSSEKSYVYTTTTIQVGQTHVYTKRLYHASALVDLLSVRCRLSGGLWRVSGCPWTVSSGNNVPYLTSSVTFWGWSFDRGGSWDWFYSGTLVSWSSPSCFSCISSLLALLHRILAWIPWGMLLSFMPFSVFLDLASCLLDWALSVVWLLVVVGSVLEKIIVNALNYFSEFYFWPFFCQLKKNLEDFTPCKVWYYYLLYLHYIHYQGSKPGGVYTGKI